MSKQKYETIKIKDNDLEDAPGFYKSVSGSPLANVVDSISNLNGTFIILSEVLNLNVLVEEPPPMTTVGYTKVDSSHKLKNKIPIVSITLENDLVPIGNPEYIISNAFDIDKNNFSFEIYSLSGLELTFKIRAFVFEII